MLTPEQVAEMLSKGEMFPKGFLLWLATHDATIRADERMKAATRWAYALNDIVDMGPAEAGQYLVDVIHGVAAARGEREDLLYAAERAAAARGEDTSHA